MAILGVETLVYCVDDVQKSVDFFEDFGLRILERDSSHARFKLPDNSHVIIRSIKDAPIGRSQVEGPGVHEVIWGVDSQEHLDQMVARVGTDREVERDADGTVRFVADGGIAMALRLWPSHRMPRTAVDPVNSPGNTNRLNVHRKWIARAFPQRIMHVVYLVPDPELCLKFVCERLDFRLTDRQRGMGVYARCDGVTDHHSIFFFDSNSPMSGGNGRVLFNHVNYHVTDVDEIMAGKLYMERRGWLPSVWGLGRHRISSALFFYLPCPAGGEAEYGADQDQVDDNWVPRNWDAKFGFAQWVQNVPRFWIEGPSWDVRFDDQTVPHPGDVKPRPYNLLDNSPKAAKSQ
jgi:catechol 2,3-dioxygenase-like lactoylglutathione lyase family enzyme